MPNVASSNASVCGRQQVAWLAIDCYCPFRLQRGAVVERDRDGALDKALWGEVERTMSDYFAYPGVKEWWSTRKHWLTDEFRAVVEALIARNPKPILHAAYKLDTPPKA